MHALLVIDDNPIILSLCQMVLGKAGFRLFKARRPDEGLAILSEHPEISACLVDSRFEYPTTAEFLKTLQSDFKTQNLAIIVLESHQPPLEKELDQVPEKWMTRHPNVARILKKPFTPSLLLQAVYQVLRFKFQPTQPAPPKRVKSLKKSRKGFSSLQNVDISLHAFPATGLALQGEVNHIPLAEVLQILVIQNKTGVLRLKLKKQEVLIFISKGQVQFACSDILQEEFRLGRVLTQSGTIKPKALNRILKERPESDLPLGNYLIKKELLKPDEVHLALKEQTSTLIYEILRWKTGRFCFYVLKELPKLAQEAALSLRLEELLLEGFRRMDEWEVFEKSIGPLNTVLERTMQSTVVLENLSHQEMTLISAINGSFTLEELASQLHFTRFETYRICHELFNRKFLHKRPEGNDASRMFNA